ncbi:hypothetical protein OV203_46810 [Nannocystis sp. ILAH1]|uniref:hypothetical protein n=1 Tax=Nannocystis sp. ILAH1 TaxID=2996789 RepID=UPI00226E0434|nr:hypothetical protein [Nannocystis sp. ILAH1]MCY0994727.1 hypothetical protein [Nannocystis sp. ILAH1]
MTRFASAFAALAAAATLTACGPRYQTVTFELRSQPPVPVRLTGEEIEIPAGIAVSVHVTIESSARIEFTNKDALALNSQDRDILLSEATPGAHNFVLVGVAAGETCLAVEVEHEEEECIPVRVVAAD